MLSRLVNLLFQAGWVTEKHLAWKAGTYLMLEASHLAAYRQSLSRAPQAMQV